MATGNLAKEVFLTPPLSIAGCRLWLDGADPSTFKFSSGTTINTWINKVGNGSNATPYGPGTTVTYVSSSNAVYFPGSSGLITPIITPTNRVQSGFFVASVASGTGLNVGVIQGSGNALAGRQFRTNGTGLLISLKEDTSGLLTSGTTPINTLMMLGYTDDGTTLIHTVNGTTGSGTTATQLAANTAVTLGYSYNTEYMIGYINEAIIYTIALTTDQRQQIEGYLAWKWGLQTSLPASHPYSFSYPYQPTIRTVPLKATSSSYFFPTAISGCQLWMDATDSTTITRSGANVTQWNDKANLYTGTATNNPQYNSSPINGLPTIHFDGASSRYVLLTANNFNYSFMTYFMVIRWVSGSGGFMGTDTPSNYGRALAVNSPNVQLLLYSQFYTTTVQLTANQPCILSAYFNSTTDFTVILNGVKTLFSVGQGSGNTNTNGFNIGVFNPSNGLNHSFDMGEGIVYNSILSDAQRQQVEGYLAWKWGLTSSLQQPHPNSTTAYVPFPFPTAIPKASTRVWSPLRISGSQLWMDGSDPAGTGAAPANGAIVSSWVDKSGNSNNAAATVSGATFTAASQNGNGYITFPTGKYFTTTNFVPSANNTPTIFLVCQQTGYSGSGNSEIIYSTVGSPYPFYTLDILGNLGNKILNVNMYSNAGQSGSISIASPTLVSIVGSGSPSYNVTLWGNGSSNVTFTGSSTNPMSVSMGLYIGAQSGFIGNIYEIIIFDTAFTTAQRQQVEGYLAWKWGLQTSLPGGHPYINFPPSP